MNGALIESWTVTVIFMFNKFWLFNYKKGTIMNSSQPVA